MVKTFVVISPVRRDSQGIASTKHASLFLGSDVMCTILLKDNLIHGRYLAELTKEVFDDLEASKYQHAEYRISIYGRKEVEWDTLSSWICTNKLVSDNVVWLIQIPRLYQVITFRSGSSAQQDAGIFLESIFYLR